MMKRWWTIPALLAVAALLAIGVPAGLRLLARNDAEAAVLAYDRALAEAVQLHDPELIGDVATGRELTRVSSYITLLWGTGVVLESTLIDAQVSDVVSTEPTVTAIARETWRYQERDADSGEAKGEPVVQTLTLRYTLVRGSDGVLRVYLSEDLGEPADE